MGRFGKLMSQSILKLGKGTFKYSDTALNWLQNHPDLLGLALVLTSEGTVEFSKMARMD